MIDLYLMSPPPPSWRLSGRANFRSAGAGEVDARAAIREWVALADALEARGGRVVCLVPTDDRLTGLPYAAECGHAIARGDEHLFLLPRMRAPHRVPEAALWRAMVAAIGWTALDAIPEGAFWEAQGDVASFRGRAILFHGGRTDRAGAGAAARWFSEGALSIAIREPAFHGNLALLPLDAADRLLVCRDLVDPGALDEAFPGAIVPITADEVRAYAANGLPVGRDVLFPDSAPPRVRALVESLGLGAVLLPMPELCGKGGGGPRCLVSHARVDEGVAVPPEYDYRLRRAEILGA